jgi:hypothetical protein
VAFVFKFEARIFNGQKTSGAFLAVRVLRFLRRLFRRLFPSLAERCVLPTVLVGPFRYLTFRLVDLLAEARQTTTQNKTLFVGTFFRTLPLQRQLAFVVEVGRSVRLASNRFSFAFQRKTFSVVLRRFLFPRVGSFYNDLTDCAGDKPTSASYTSFVWENARSPASFLTREFCDFAVKSRFCRSALQDVVSSISTATSYWRYDGL